MTAKFVWFDLNTKDADKAIPFYTQLFGWDLEQWTPEGAPEGTPAYPMVGIGGTSFGGINNLPAEAPAPSHWMGHINVPDVDAAKARAEKMGAQFPMGIMEIPTVGRMAMMIDPQGAAASLFTPAGEMSDLPEMQAHGMIGWTELASNDLAGHSAFYGEVVGWKAAASDMSEHPDYLLLGNGDARGGVAGLSKAFEGMPTAWTLYFSTDDVDKTVAQVAELGGTVAVPPFDVPKIGRMAMCMGPDGSFFGVSQWSMAQDEDC